MKGLRLWRLRGRGGRSVSPAADAQHGPITAVSQADDSTDWRLIGGGRLNRLMRLEQRIVLDAAGAAVADAQCADHADDSTGTADGAPHAGHGTDGHSTSHDSVAEADHLLLISSRIVGAEELAGATGDDVASIVVDDGDAAVEHLVEQLRRQVGRAEWQSIAIAGHAIDGGFAVGDLQITAATSADPAVQQFWHAVAGMLDGGGRIDLLACDLAGSEQGATLIDSIEQLTGINVAASDDLTGNAAQGGDWLLETDGINAAAVYFSTESISAFEGTLANTSPTVNAMDFDFFLNAISEDVASVSNSGTTIADIIASNSDAIGDIDGDPLGVAIVDAITDGKGAWEYTTNDGGSWSAMPGGLSVNNAFLLAGDVAGVRIRFVPNANVNDTSWGPPFWPWAEFKAWDQTAGAHLGFADVSGGGVGTSPYSADSGYINAVVNAVNDAPINTVPGAQATSINTPVTFTGATAISIADVDDTDVIGDEWQVTLTASDGTLSLGGVGGLTFSTGDGADDATMTFTGTIANINTALDGLAFTPTTDWIGTATLTVLTSDQGNVGTPGALSDSDGIDIAVNSAPVLDSSGSMSLTAVNEDPLLTDAGTTVTNIISSAGGDRITDVDVDSEGIAVIGVDDVNGTWQYTLNGVDWFNVDDGGLADNHALLLEDTDAIRFRPDADWNGTVDPGLTFRAWDRTSGSAGNYVDASVNGGTTSFSVASETASILVNAVNDPPTVDTPLADQDAYEGLAFSFQFAGNAFGDVDSGDSLSYSAQLNGGGALPGWLSFNPATRTFSGTPGPGDVAAISVEVIATDVGGPANVSDVFNLTVHANNAPTAVTLSSTTVDENSPGAVVGTLTATDVDGSDSHTFSIVNDPTGLFEIAGAQLRLRSGESLDYETVSSVELTVRADDGRGGTFDQLMAITVNDVDESTPPPADPPPAPDPPPADDPLVSDDPPADDPAGDPVDEPPGDDDGGDDDSLNDLEQAVDDSDASENSDDSGETPGETSGDHADAATSAAAQATWLDEEEEAKLFAAQVDERTALDVTRRIDFDQSLLNDMTQPDEIKLAYSEILDLYDHASDEMLPYLQSAFRSVVESASTYRCAAAVVKMAQAEILIADRTGAVIDPLLGKLLEEVLEAQQIVRDASDELHEVIKAAAQANDGHFDRFAEDAIAAALSGLNEANEQLILSFRSLDAAARYVRDHRLADQAELVSPSIAEVVEGAKDEAEAEVERIRRQWDQAAEDVLAACLRHLVSTRPSLDVR